MKRIIIKENNTSIKELCAVCKETMKNTMPLGIFLEGTWNSVCRECAEEINGDLVKALHAFYSCN